MKDHIVIFTENEYKKLNYRKLDLLPYQKIEVAGLRLGDKKNLVFYVDDLLSRSEDTIELFFGYGRKPVVIGDSLYVTCMGFLDDSNHSKPLRTPQLHLTLKDKTNSAAIFSLGTKSHNEIFVHPKEIRTK